jgi:hypothetical protein
MTIFDRRSWWHWRSVPLEPAWPECSRTGARVVVECGDFALSDAAANVLRGAGYQVGVCHGPHGRHRCPMLEGGRCAFVEESEVVVNLLGLGGAPCGHVLPQLRVCYPDLPVVAEVPGWERRAHGRALDGVALVDSPLRGANLLTGVADAVQP